MEDPDTMASKSNLALCLRDIGEPREALRYDQELLEDKARVFGEASPEVSLTMNNLAMDFYVLKGFGKARELLSKVVEASEETLGELNQEIILSISNLALVCRAEGGGIRCIGASLWRSGCSTNQGIWSHPRIDSREKASSLDMSTRARQNR